MRIRVANPCVSVYEKEKTMKRKIELSIGIFVLIGLILLAVMIIGFGDYQYVGERYTIYAIFNYISGVVEGAPVRYAGVDVGKVLKPVILVTEDGHTKVRLGLGINKSVGVKKDSEAVINSLGIIGEKYVELFPGSPGAPMLKPGDEIQGIDPIALEAVMSSAQRVLTKLDGALSSISNVLGGETQANIKTTIVNFRNFGRDIDRLSKKVELIINKINRGEGTIGKLIYAQELHDELLALIKGIKEHGIFYKAKDEAKEVKKAETAEKGFGPRK